MLSPTAPLPRAPEYDLKQTLHKSKPVSMWLLMTGYRGLYLIAALSTGLAALANTATFLLLRYFIDDWLSVETPAVSLWLIVAGFLVLAGLQAFFTFNSRRLAAQSAEGIALRIRNYLYDHIQRLTFRYHAKTQTGDLLQRATSDVDTIRRFFADQAIESGRISLLFIVNFVAAHWYLNWWLAVISVIILPVVMVISILFFKRIEKSLQALSGTGCQALFTPAGKSHRRAGCQSLCSPAI
jgi:ATP-binding cassette subfamily B protein